METYKKLALKQTEIIDHIKFIAKDLFKDSQPSSDRYNNFSYKHQHQPKSPTKDFTRTPHRKTSREKKGVGNTANSSNGLVSTLPNKSRSKKKRIFENFDEFWVKCHQSPERRQTTPLIDRINKSIYNQFKSERKGQHEMNDHLDSENREALWTDFLKRDEDWKKEKISHQRERQMKEISSQSPEIRSRIKTISNLNYSDLQAEMHMTQVQKSIKILRLQTQKLRKKVLNIPDTQKPPSKSSLRKTYHPK